MSESRNDTTPKDVNDLYEKYKHSTDAVNKKHIHLMRALRAGLSKFSKDECTTKKLQLVERDQVDTNSPEWFYHYKVKDVTGNTNWESFGPLQHTAQSEALDSSFSNLKSVIDDVRNDRPSQSMPQKTVQFPKMPTNENDANKQGWKAVEKGWTNQHCSVTVAEHLHEKQACHSWAQTRQADITCKKACTRYVCEWTDNTTTPPKKHKWEVTRSKNHTGKGQLRCNETDVSGNVDYIASFYWVVKPEMGAQAASLNWLTLLHAVYEASRSQINKDNLKDFQVFRDKDNHLVTAVCTLIDPNDPNRETRYVQCTLCFPWKHPAPSASAGQTNNVQGTWTRRQTFVRGYCTEVNVEEGTLYKMSKGPQGSTSMMATSASAPVGTCHSSDPWTTLTQPTVGQSTAARTSLFSNSSPLPMYKGRVKVSEAKEHNIYGMSRAAAMEACAKHHDPKEVMEELRNNLQRISQKEVQCCREIMAQKFVPIPDVGKLRVW